MATIAPPAEAQYADAVAGTIRRGGRLRNFDGLFKGILLFSLLTCLAFLMILLADVLDGGWSTLADRGTSFLTSGTSSNAASAGVWQGLKGSTIIAVFVMGVAIPIGVATAVYLEEYAPDNRMTRWIDVNIRNLAGVPSVVYGILGLALFVKFGGPITGGRSVISAGLTMSLLVLPLVVMTAAEAIRSVPASLREGGYGVGATQWEVTRELVLPAARGGILTGVVLSLGRALGETAPLILVGAQTGFFSTGNAGWTAEFTGPFTALPMLVYHWARQPGGDFGALVSAAIIVLLAITLVFNASAIVLRARAGKRTR
ncbi:MAG: phosphate ABC transporter permease PstA [Actinobacteria bacterium]|nr:phosphate ABC transporter permease PstA [Actinomycetota bacterium]MCB9388782.1 phosphate ABC transporter permease PstA [Acidimicrobiia bacterium]